MAALIALLVALAAGPLGLAVIAAVAAVLGFALIALQVVVS